MEVTESITTDLIKKLADELIDPLKKYIEAYKSENPKENPNQYRVVNLLEGMDDLLNDYGKLETIYSGEETRIKRSQFWEFIIIAKIETIAAVGGFDLMQSVFYELEKHPQNHIYKFSAIFDNIADGIGGWAM